MQAGAAGFLIKQTAANDLLKAIREVNRGNAFFQSRRLLNGCVINVVKHLPRVDLLKRLLNSLLARPKCFN